MAPLCTATVLGDRARRNHSRSPEGGFDVPEDQADDLALAVDHGLRSAAEMSWSAEVEALRAV